MSGMALAGRDRWTRHAWTRAGRAVALLLASGCERIVDVDLDPGPVRLVIEGRLELLQGSTEGRQLIRLSITDAFTSDRAPPPATGATVAVIDEANRAVQLAESAGTPGTYETIGLLPVVGARYTLRIDYQGERYEATDRVAAVAPIDSLYFRFVGKDVFGDPGFRAAIDYTDPAGARNFYLWEQLIDGERQLVPDQSNRMHVIGGDDFYDGRRITAYQPFEESIVEPGDTVIVRQIGLSEATYRYYLALFEQSAAGHGSPFAVPPGSLRGNGANLTAPAHYPLGYFWAAEVAEARTVFAAGTPAP
jgi:hypothetical protein